VKQSRINIDPLSATSLRVEPRFDSTVLGSATAFIIRFNNNDYLVTNWHVVTGRDPDTGQCLDKNASVPNEILVNFHARGKLGTWKKVVIKLFDSDGKSRWVEHPLGKEVDVVAIRIDASEDVDLHCLDLGLGDVDIVPMPAMPISLIGYPLGLTAGDSWPIWKTGHIASDPDIDFQLGRPAFLIDATTKSGMSGAPVVLRLDRYQKKDGDHVIAGGITTKFMGVYAGRIHDDSDVGRVWRPFVITELLNHRLIFNETTRRAAPNRNAPCPCRSRKRFKECCGQST
jgi:hypothetical protein